MEKWLKGSPLLRNMPNECEYCSIIFKSPNSLLLHQTNTKRCKNYRDVIFTCKRCLFSTIGIGNIDRHMKLCQSSEYPSLNPISDMSKNISELEEEISSYKTKIEDLLDHNKNLNYNLSLEKLKVNLYHQLIKENTSIKVDNLVEVKDQEIHLFDTKKVNIPVSIHEYIDIDNTLSKNKPSSDKTNKPKKTKKHCYRSIKKSTKLTEDHMSPNNEKIQIKEKTKVDMTYLNNICNSYLKKIEQNRVYTKVFSKFKSDRMKIFPMMKIDEYTITLSEQIKNIENILKGKNYKDKKVHSTISKGLSPLESRLLSYPNYTNSHLDIEDMEKFSCMLDNSIDYTREYQPYNENKFLHLFYNYGSVLFPIKTNIERYLLNKYTIYTIIFVPLQKNVEGDPYSFYRLEKITDNKKYWTMDCRLEDLTLSIVANVLPYMKSLFKKIYYDTFGDNDFRPDYSGKYQITEIDCEQLLQNIILLSKPKKLCNLLRDLIRSKAVYKPNDNDKFNLYGDDSLQRKRFQNKEDNDIIDTIKQIFDNITSEEAVDFYRSRTI